MRTEVKINFKEVKNYLINSSEFAIESIIDSVEPFVMDYIKHPFGFAETDNVNDLDLLTKEINNSFQMLSYDTAQERNRLIKSNIKRETERWNDGKNAGFYGRHIGRLAYLLNESK